MGKAPSQMHGNAGDGGGSGNSFCPFFHDRQLLITSDPVGQEAWRDVIGGEGGGAWRRGKGKEETPPASSCVTSHHLQAAVGGPSFHLSPPHTRQNDWESRSFCWDYRSGPETGYECCKASRTYLGMGIHRIRRSYPSSSTHLSLSPLFPQLPTPQSSSQHPPQPPFQQ